MLWIIDWKATMEESCRPAYAHHAIEKEKEDEEEGEEQEREHARTGEETV